LRKFDIHDLQVETPMVCTLKHDDQELIKIMFNASFVVRVRAENTELTLRVYTQEVSDVKFESVDDKFKVENEDLAKFMMGEVIKGLNDVKTMGSGWPIAHRKFPSTKFLDNYLLIFDAAQQ
jgi:hypothetical protein